MNLRSVLKYEQYIDMYMYLLENKLTFIVTTYTSLAPLISKISGTLVQEIVSTLMLGMKSDKAI